MSLTNNAGSNGPLISVLLPAYNAEKYIKEAVESILKQTFTCFEFIIINDGSTDGTLAILEEYAKKDKRIRLISRKNKGLVVTLNEGIGLAKAPLIARMDADDIALPERFAIQYEYLEANKEVVLVAGMVRVIDPDGDPLCVWNKLTGSEDIQDAHLNAVNGSAVCHPAVLMRKQAVKGAGGYKSDTYPAEDLDLFLRLSLVGQLVNLPTVVLKYRIHENSICVSQHNAQKLKVVEVVNKARSKRGLVPLAQTSALEGEIDKSSFGLKWGWWALGSGFICTARKYAVRQVVLSPFSFNTWRFVFCVLRER